MQNLSEAIYTADSHLTDGREPEVASHLVENRSCSRLVFFLRKRKPREPLYPSYVYFYVFVFFFSDPVSNNSEELKTIKTTNVFKLKRVEFFGDVVARWFHKFSQRRSTGVSRCQLSSATRVARRRCIENEVRKSRPRLYLVIPMRLSRVVSPHASFELGAKFDRISEKESVNIERSKVVRIFK